MTYEEARKKALSVKWKINECFSGEGCWCRLIEPEEPIIYNTNGEIEETYAIAHSGCIEKDIAEYLVKLHNDSLEKNDNQR